jgi:phosphocarrier protein
MVKTVVTIENETGLHARPATEISKVAMKYKCDVNLIANGKNINAKSPLMIMAAGIKSKTEIEIVCDGEDEQSALEELKSTFENNI